MRRRLFLSALPPALFWPRGRAAGAPLASVTAVPEPHFPSRLYQFVWRNWDLANLDRMAAVVEARPADLARLAKEMGLPPKRPLNADYLRRIYITVIRQNWHLLPDDQLIALLGWDAARFAFTLKEDDFLDHKLGMVKPACETLRYRAPTAPERERARAMRASLARWIPGGVKSLGQPRFAFVDEISALEPGPGWRVQAPAGNAALAAAAQRFGREERTREW